jgi:hypothetical protein
MTLKYDFKKSYLSNETKQRNQTFCICSQDGRLLPEKNEAKQQWPPFFFGGGGFKDKILGRIYDL